MFTVDRSQFIHWFNGELFVRDSECRCWVYDHEDHEEAERRMELGETIGLTVKGVVVSTMSLTQDGLEERNIEK